MELLGAVACSRPPPPESDAAAEDTVIGFDERGCQGMVQLSLRRGPYSHTIEHDLGDGCAPIELRRLEDHISAVIDPAIHDLVECEARTCPP